MVTLYSSFLKKVPLFEPLPSTVIGALASKLETKLYMPNEFVVREGVIGSSMYLIQRGCARVIKSIGTKEQTEICKLTEGNFFGEVSIVAASHTKRGCSVISHTVLLVCRLAKEDVFEIGKMEPLLLYTLRKVAISRRRELGEDIQTTSGVAQTAMCVKGVTNRLRRLKVPTSNRASPTAGPTPSADDASPAKCKSKGAVIRSLMGLRRATTRRIEPSSSATGRATITPASAAMGMPLENHPVHSLLGRRTGFSRVSRVWSIATALRSPNNSPALSNAIGAQASAGVWPSPYAGGSVQPSVEDAVTMTPLRCSLGEPCSGELTSGYTSRVSAPTGAAEIDHKAPQHGDGAHSVPELVVDPAAAMQSIAEEELSQHAAEFKLDESSPYEGGLVVLVRKVQAHRQRLRDEQQALEALEHEMVRLAAAQPAR